MIDDKTRAEWINKVNSSVYELRDADNKIKADKSKIR